MIKDNQIKVKFIENNLPPIISGQYDLSAKHQIKGKGEKGDFDSTFTDNKVIYINGVRFALNPDQVYSVFPANNSSGDYNNCFPHIVLKTASLPWQRETASMIIEDNIKIHYPWLALLVFYDGEEPNITTLPIAKFGDTKDDPRVLAVQQAKNIECSDDAQCNKIEISKELFNKIVPAKKDLPYLAHVREVSVKKKTIDPQIVLLGNTISEYQSFSVIIANRLAPTNQKCTVHLVSLEDMGKYLPEYDDKKKQMIPSLDLEKYEIIRLISLKNWSFTSAKSISEEKGKFLSQLVSQLNRKDPTRAVSDNNKGYSKVVPITLKLPIVDGLDKDIKPVLDMGYIPMNHNMRDGSTTVSWYRGPFAPYKTQERKVKTKANDSRSISLYNNSSDALLLYDPEWGMFDVSYAAAWQLGRLLAVQNQNFAQKLYNYKQKKLLELIDNYGDQHYLDTITNLINVNKEQALRISTDKPLLRSNRKKKTLTPNQRLMSSIVSHILSSHL